MFTCVFSVSIVPVYVCAFTFVCSYSRFFNYFMSPSGGPAMLALGEIRLQILQLRMPLMATSRLSTSHSQT